MDNGSVLPTTSRQRANSNPLPTTAMRAASALALLSSLIMIALALLLETAFESSVSKAHKWVRIPVDRLGDGHFVLPLALLKTTSVDRVVMPVLFALMIIVASALLVQNLQLERFSF